MVASAAMSSPRRLPGITNATTDGLGSTLSISCDQVTQSILVNHSGSGLSRRRRPPPNDMSTSTATSSVALVIPGRAGDLEEVDSSLRRTAWTPCSHRAFASAHRVLHRPERLPAGRVARRIRFVAHRRQIGALSPRKVEQGLDAGARLNALRLCGKGDACSVSEPAIAPRRSFNWRYDR